MQPPKSKCVALQLVLNLTNYPFINARICQSRNPSNWNLKFGRILFHFPALYTTNAPALKTAFLQPDLRPATIPDNYTSILAPNPYSCIHTSFENSELDDFKEASGAILRCESWLRKKEPAIGSDSISASNGAN